MKIKGAIFDMDGTLVDSLMFWGYLWKRVGKVYFNDENFTPDATIEKALRTAIFADGMTHFKEYYRLPGEVSEFVSFCDNGLAEFYKTVASPKKGAFALLEDLRKKGIKICLASATAMKDIQIAIAHHDLAKYFDGVISCADLGVGKDKPDIYLEAMRLLSLSPEETCVFEDSFVALETAKGIGCYTVGIYDQYNSDQDRLRNASEIYVEDGQALDVLINHIQKL